jgi:subtilisin family serine protease
MDDNTTLQYGGRELTLHKSPRLIALRPRKGRVFEMGATALGLGTTGLDTCMSDFSLHGCSGSRSNVDALLNALRLETSVAKGTHVYHSSSDEVPFVPTGELFIRFSVAAALDNCNALLDEHALSVTRVVGKRQIIAQVTAESSNPIKVALDLQGRGEVEVAEPDLATPGQLEGFQLPADVLLPKQWHLCNVGVVDGSAIGLKVGADARVVPAWQLAESAGSREVIVAVIDDGFDLSHPDLAGHAKIVHPWDFSRKEADPRPGYATGFPWFDQRSQQWVGNWHGTACAGVAVGNANGQGIVGAAPGCRLMPIRWSNVLNDSQIEAWFAYALANKAWIVSCSWGAAAKYFPLSTRQRLAIEGCAHLGRDGLGSVIVFAAGNDSRNIDDPTRRSLCGFATNPDVISVAASTSRDTRASYSNFGNAISVCAPSSGPGGRSIVTSDVTGTFLDGDKPVEAGYAPGSYTEEFGGTSSAAPLVAGICALVLSVQPSLTAREVKALIQRTARRIGPENAYDSHGHSKYFGFGCVNAEAAIQAVLNGRVIQGP